MSMIGNFLRVSETELNSYLADSSLLEKRVYTDEMEEHDPQLLDIDKSWEGILFLLTGQGAENTVHPMSALFFSGQLVDETQDIGYGPAHYLTAEQVRTLNPLIAAISTAELGARYDADKMTELGIYPEMWRATGMDSYLTEYFEVLQAFYAEAAKNGEAVIAFIR